MADTNWHWINAVNPAGPHKVTPRKSLDRRLLSFWSKRVQREVREVNHIFGNVKPAGFIGKAVDSTDDIHDSPVGHKPAGIAWIDGEMRPVW